VRPRPDCPGTEWPPDPDLRLSRETGFAGRTLLLVADFPYERDEGTDSELFVAIEEAILSLCRAVFDAGGRIACRVDHVVAPLALEVAAEYAPPEPVVVLVVAHPDLLALAKELHDEYPWSTVVPFAPSESEPTNMTRETVHRVEPAAAVGIGDLSALGHDLHAIRSADVQVHLVEPTLVGEADRDPHDREVVAEFLPDGWKPGEDRLEVPFPYVLQRLVSRLGER
jgi:hypothetical protein